MGGVSATMTPLMARTYRGFSAETEGVAAGDTAESLRDAV